MSLSGARGLIGISANAACELFAAAVAESLDDRQFYRLVTGQEYDGEYGERVSARRRGAKFEANLYENDASLLRQAVAPVCRRDPERLWVRNLADEVPGGRDGVRAMRLARTRRIWRDVNRGTRVPDVLIQPQVRVWVGPAEDDFVYISPDFMAWDAKARIYVPGEAKSFIARDGVLDSSDLELTRLQGAVQVLAVREEAVRLGVPVERVRNRAQFLFATPYGLKPSAPVMETLEAEVREIERGIAALRRVRDRLDELRGGEAVALGNLVDELQTNYQTSCLRTCILAHRCKDAAAGRMRVLGDRAADLVGADFSVERFYALLRGAEPRTEQERALQPLLGDVAALLRRTA